MRMRGNFFVRIDGHFIDFVSARAIEHLPHAPGVIHDVAPIENIGIFFIIEGSYLFDVRHALFFGYVQRVARIDHNEILNVVEDDGFVLFGVDHIGIAAKYFEREGILFALSLVIAESFQVHDTVESEPCADKGCPFGMEYLSERIRRHACRHFTGNDSVEHFHAAAAPQQIPIVQRVEKDARPPGDDAAIPKVIPFLRPHGRKARYVFPAVRNIAVSVPLVHDRGADDAHAVLRDDFFQIRHRTVIIPVQNNIGGYDEYFLLGLTPKKCNRNGEGRFDGLFFKEKGAVESLKGTELTAQNALVPSVRQNDVLVAKRNVAQDGLLEHRTMIAYLHKLFGVIFAGQRPQSIAAAARQHKTFHNLSLSSPKTRPSARSSRYSFLSFFLP